MGNILRMKGLGRVAPIIAACLLFTSPSPADETIPAPRPRTPPPPTASSTVLAGEEAHVPVRSRFDELRFSYNGSAYRNATYGNQTRSFRADETYELHTMGVRAKDHFAGLDWQLRAMTRWTDDPQVTFRDDIHFTSFYTTLARRNVWDVRLGDLFPNLSRYTIQRSLDGFQGHYHRPFERGHLDLVGVAGRVIREREGSRYRRWGTGTAVTYNDTAGVGPLLSYKIGYRSATTDDDAASIDVRGTATDAEVVNHSFIWEGRLRDGWRWDGEHAVSNGSSSMGVNPEKIGHASRINGIYRRPAGLPAYLGWHRLLPFAANINYEEVDADFLSPLGSSSADRRTYGFRTAHRWSRAFSWNTRYTYSENDLRNTTRQRTRNKTYRIDFQSFPFMIMDGMRIPSIRNPSGGRTSPPPLDFPDHLERLRFDFAFQFNQNDRADGAALRRIEQYIYGLQYANWGYMMRGRYLFQITDDDVNAARDARIEDWSVSIARPINIRSWNLRLSPNASYRHKVDVTIRGENMTRTQTTSFGLGGSWEEFNFSFRYSINDSDRNAAQKDSLNNTFRSTLTYRPYAIPDLTVTGSYSYKDYDDEAPGRSYRETETKVSVGYNF